MTENKVLTFDNLKLIPGQPLQLEFNGYDSNRDRSALVGYLKGRNILISTPAKQGVAMSVKPKTSVRVRLFVNHINGACAFEAMVEHVSVIPFPHLHLTWPEKLVIGEVRKSMRAKVHIVSSVMFQDSATAKKHTTTAVIDDLSTHGCRIYGQNINAQEAQEVDLVFKILIGTIDRTLHIKSIVRSILKNEAQGGFFYGLQFIDVPEDTNIALQAYVLTKFHDQ